MIIETSGLSWNLRLMYVSNLSDKVTTSKNLKKNHEQEDVKSNVDSQRTPDKQQQQMNKDSLYIQIIGTVTSLRMQQHQD